MSTGGAASEVTVNVRVREADFDDDRDAKGFIEVLDSYASAPVGGGRPLAPEVRERVVPMLREHPMSLVLLAFVGDEPVGVAVCFFGLSTFRARPLLNIHDLAVLPKHQGKGVGPALLAAVEDHARRNGCCKLTLEVQDDNTRARGVYQRFGFEDYDLGSTRFLVKPLGE
jgi:ribosomal protein S18 acetylase RimI-like enzyme